MTKNAQKLSTIIVNEELFPPHVWQQAMRTQERNRLLNQNWPIELDFDYKTKMNIYRCYPYLFLDIFSAISLSAVSDFSLATYLFANSLFCADTVMDFNLSAYKKTQTLSLMMAMQKEAYALLQSLFPPASPFWVHFHAYLSHYASSCLLEKKFSQGNLPWQEYNEQTAYDIATGKAGVSRAVIAGLAALSGDASSLEIL